MSNLKGLVPELLPPAEIFAGTPTPFRLRLHNRKKRLPSFLIRVQSASGRGTTLNVMPPDSTTETALSLSFPRRGWNRIGTVTVSSPFPVNFFTRFWTFSMEEDLVVFPRLIQGAAVGDASAERQAGSIARREHGQDGELERIAPYSGREPLRAIHWKLSARVDDLLVKQFGRQSVPPLVIDLERLSGGTLEERISKASWLVRRTVNQRPVGLRLGRSTIPPASGRSHGDLLLRELALYGLD